MHRDGYVVVFFRDFSDEAFKGQQFPGTWENAAAMFLNKFNIAFACNNSVNDIRQKAKKLKKKIKDDTVDVSFQTKLFEESESCEVFSRCGS